MTKEKIDEVDEILLYLLDQCTRSSLNDVIPNQTSYNAEAVAVMYLEKKGLVKIIQGKFPDNI